ncbi:MAG: flagellar biosynthesis protein FlgD [Candidatus Contendobacter sp.]|nr:flagellar biosynthesis protein FlgD [Candidatus Contendobacter sp.]
MTTISSVGTNAASSSSSTTTDKKANDQLDQADFLKLMTTQLQNQDPTKPLDGQQFMAQLAQFSTLNGIMDMKASLDKLVTALTPK